MNIAKIYKKMKKDSLSFKAMASMLEPPISAALLNYHVRKFCKENGLIAPKCAAGRKSKKLQFKIKKK